MIKFRNPISDIGILIQNFKKIYVEFSNVEYFDLDDIAELFAREKLASSSGYTGNEALKRSYQIKDDSRKSMKMQAKSYAELFRFLGWITSNDKALHFNFTFLGVHVALSGNSSKLLFEQSLLGIEYPNNILQVKFKDINKPFISILNFAHELDGILHRDEILIGPMNLANGYSTNEIEEKINLIRNIRKTHKINVLNDEISKLAKENRMQPNSVRNLTRFVISALSFSGWFEKKKLKVYGTNSTFLVLTEKGKSVVETIAASQNISGRDVKVNSPQGKETAELGLLCFFKRAGFDVDSEINKHKETFNRLRDNHDTILFSPYQFFSFEELEQVLPQYALHNISTKHESATIAAYSNTLQPIYTNIFLENKREHINRNNEVGDMLLTRLKNSHSDSCINKATDLFIDEVKYMKQADFYPLVAKLMGYIFNRDAYAPSAENNNMRYDVMIPDERYSIPVEVKSPTEEEMLSIKAVRQATENKVLLLARKPHPTTFAMSSFACGYKIPNNRSDVYKLINDIHQTYGINIAIIDIETLIRAAFYCAKQKAYFEIKEFENKRGVIKLENIQKQK